MWRAMSTRVACAGHEGCIGRNKRLNLVDADTTLSRPCSCFGGKVSRLSIAFWRGSKGKWIGATLMALLLGTWALWSTLASAPLRDHPVGLMNRQYADPERRSWETDEARPLKALVWYPAAAGTLEKNWTVAIFQAGRNAQGAALSASPAKLPLVVLSHGTGGSAIALSWLAEYLAQNGFIVAAVNHHGNTAAEASPRLEGTLVWWDRAQDVKVLIDRLLADPRIGSRIDTQRIGVAGFSIGGYTALATVGVRLSRAQFDSFCAVEKNCQPPPEISARYTKAEAWRLIHEDGRLKRELERMEDSYEDKRIRAAFVMAPAVDFAMTPQSFAAVRVPVHMVVGSDDDQAVSVANAQQMARQMTGAQLEVLPKGTHYMFLAPCNTLGKLTAKEICVDAPGTDRVAVHGKVAADALAFFRQSFQ